jgi:putative DNA primase/helicase
MSYSPNGVLAVADEMAGMIASWGTKGQEAARGFFLTAWNGNEPYVVDRVERGTQRIPRAYLCMMGGFQPGVLASYVQQTMAGGSGDDGLVQRFQMLIYPDFPKDLAEVDRAADQAAADRMRDAVLRLRRLTPSNVGAQIEQNGGRGYLHFADDAQVLFDVARRKIETAARYGSHSAPISSHLAKTPGTIAKLALLIHLIDGGIGPVSVRATKRALRWGKYLFAHAKRIYGMSGTAHVNAAKHLLDKVQEGKLGRQFTPREVKGKGWSGLTTHDAVGGALDLLVQTHWLRVHMQETGGRPKEVYTVHPQALTGPA